VWRPCSGETARRALRGCAVYTSAILHPNSNPCRRQLSHTNNRSPACTRCFQHPGKSPIPTSLLKSPTSSTPPRHRVVGAIQGHISEVIEEPNAEPLEPSDPGDGDDNGDPDPDPDPESSTISEADDPLPNPNPNAEANSEEQVGRRMLAALERLADHGLGGGAE
jgi:hypothetical protein